MRILVFGAGAVGGYVGGILSAAGADVTLVARGAHLAAMASRGLVLESATRGRSERIRVRACAPGEEQPPYDLVFVGLKSHQLAPNAAHLARLLGPCGMLLLAQNGIPYWYFEKLDSPLRGTRLPSLDPDGMLARTLPIDAVIGGVAWKPADIVAPGHIRLADQPTDRLVVGELDHRISPRLEAIRALFEPAGWPVLVTEDVRRFKWRKLLSNAVFNPLGAITQSSARQIVQYPPARRFAFEMVREVHAVARALGVDPGMTPEQVMDYTEKRVDIPSSTLQDVRAGRELELDALLNAVIDIARLVAVPVPLLEFCAACAGLVNRRMVEDRVAFPAVPLPARA